MGQLLLVKSLFATAQAAGMVTATVGKSGAAYIQDLGKGGYFLDENTVQPRSLVTELQSNNIALPANTVNGYSGTDAVTLAATNGSPTARAGYVTFNTTAYDPNGQLTVAARDSTDTTQGAPEDAANKYMMSVFTSYILPKKNPMLSLIWFRTPDNVEHGYGPGSANARAGLRSQDARLGELMAALKAQGLDTSTNIVVVSDHAHSSVSGPASLYPLRAIAASATAPNGAAINGSTSGTSAATLGGVSTTGFSFSGDVRSADLLTYRGFKAYDGTGCSTSAMYGLSANGTPTVPVRADTTGTLCGAANTKYQAVSATLAAPVASFKVPAPGSLPTNGIVVAANGGSDYFYVPSHDLTTIRNLVRFLQQREEYGAIFVDSRYGSMPGTLAMAQVNLENTTRRRQWPARRRRLLRLGQYRDDPGEDRDRVRKHRRTARDAWQLRSDRRAQHADRVGAVVQEVARPRQPDGQCRCRADGCLPARADDAAGGRTDRQRGAGLPAKRQHAQRRGLVGHPVRRCGERAGVRDAARSDRQYPRYDLPAGDVYDHAAGQGPDHRRQDLSVLRLCQGDAPVRIRPIAGAIRSGLIALAFCWPAAPVVAAAPPLGLSFDRVFSAAGEPPVLHYRVLFVGTDRVHRMELWRDHDRRVKRLTDRAIATFATHRPGDAGYSMTVLDLQRRISTRIDRSNLYRVGNFTDWFDLTHGLRHPKGAYRLTTGDAPTGMPVSAAPCRWYDLTQGQRTAHICWDARNHVPQLIATANGHPVWRIVAIDTAPVAAATFVANDRGFVKNDANRDIEGD